jgi:DNA polymerase III alpha subunit
MIDEHVEQVRSLGGWFPTDFPELDAQYRRACAAPEASSLDLVPCFNDPMADNFMVDDAGTRTNFRRCSSARSGVPLFQEQAMRVAIVAAGFTPSDADQLRRAMATFKHTQGVGVYHELLVGGMVRRGYDPDMAERVFKQIEGFGSYGFPESQASSRRSPRWLWYKNNLLRHFMTAG